MDQCLAVLGLVAIIIGSETEAAAFGIKVCGVEVDQRVSSTVNYVGLPQLCQQHHTQARTAPAVIRTTGRSIHVDLRLS